MQASGRLELAARLSRGRLPQAGRAVGTSCDDGAAVRAEGHGLDPVGVHERLAQRCAASRFPHSRGFVAARRRYEGAVGAEGRRPDLSTVRQGLADRLPRGSVPQPRGARPAAGQQDFAVGTEGDGRDLPLVLQDQVQMERELTMRGGQVRSNDVLQLGVAGRRDLQAVTQHQHPARTISLFQQPQAPFQGQTSGEPLRLPAEMFGSCPLSFRIPQGRLGEPLLLAELDREGVAGGKTGRRHQRHDTQQAGRGRCRVPLAPALHALTWPMCRAVTGWPSWNRRKSSASAPRGVTVCRALFRGTSGRSSPGPAAPSAASATAAPDPESEPAQRVQGVGPLERRPTRQRLVQDRPQSVDVGGRADRRRWLSAPGLLRRHVARRAQDLAGSGQVLRRRPRLARPKSVIFGRLPLSASSTLAGLRSRWTMPCSCA